MIGNTNAEGLLVADVVLGKDLSPTELKGLIENPILFVELQIQIELLPHSMARANLKKK